MSDSLFGSVAVYGQSRWLSTRFSQIGAGTGNAVVLATAGIVRKIAIVPGAVTDIFTVHNVSTTAGILAANEIFFLTATGLTLGIPVYFDLAEGWDCSAGICVQTINAGATTSRMFISYDKIK